MALENAYVYERLQLTLILGDARNWPADKPVLKKLLHNEIEYVIIPNMDWNIINALLSEMNLTDNWTEIHTDTIFTAWKNSAVASSNN